jgi:hypothetical protein
VEVIALATFHYPGQWPLWTYAIISLLSDLAVFTPGMSHLKFPSKIGMRTAFPLATFVPLGRLGFAGTHVACLIQKIGPASRWRMFALRCA